MIQRVTYNEDDNMVMEFDEEGAEYLIDGLQDLMDNEIGAEFATASVWTIDAPWWRFWNRTGEPVVGEFILRRVG